jgi:cytochrome c-type biogenesis protein CcmH
MKQTLICLLLSVLFCVGVSAKTATVDEVAGKISCFCGTCPHLVVTNCGCSVADQIKGDVQKMINSGMTEDQILNVFVSRYGQTVLAAPPKKGFNLTAWLIPFGGFLAGAGILTIYLNKQRRSFRASEGKQEDGSAQHGPSVEGEDYYRNQLKKELEKRR